MENGKQVSCRIADSPSQGFSLAFQFSRIDLGFISDFLTMEGQVVSSTQDVTRRRRSRRRRRTTTTIAWIWARNSGLNVLTSQNGSQSFCIACKVMVFLTWCQTRFTFPSGRRSVMTGATIEAAMWPTMEMPWQMRS